MPRSPSVRPWSPVSESGSVTIWPLPGDLLQPAGPIAEDRRQRPVAAAADGGLPERGEEGDVVGIVDNRVVEAAEDAIAVGVGLPRARDELDSRRADDGDRALVAGEVGRGLRVGRLVEADRHRRAAGVVERERLREAVGGDHAVCRRVPRRRSGRARRWSGRRSGRGRWRSRRGSAILFACARKATRPASSSADVLEPPERPAAGGPARRCARSRRAAPPRRVAVR